MAEKPIRVAITTGDIDGIGTEIVGKALAKLKPKRNIQFYLWRSPRCPTKHLRLIDSQFKRITVSSWPEALNTSPRSPREVVDINSSLPPPCWVDLSAKASMFGHIDAIATAPLSKTSIQAANFKVIGHTEMLKKVAKVDPLFMAFIGKEFNVLLATGHIPMSEVAKALKKERLEAALRAAQKLRGLLPARVAKKPIALVGLNPHAGEEGIIGNHESTVIAEVLTKLRKGRIPIQGPLVPDAAFFPENWKKYSVYVATYHDQGLIPFKMIHGQDAGVHITMGLPFVRTSVDHGCAKDIFGRNKANPNSMIEALSWAIKLSRMED